MSTAVAMDDKLKSQLMDSLKKAYNYSEIKLEEKVDEQLNTDFEMVKQIVGGIRNFRKEKNIGFKEQLVLISDAVIPYVDIVQKLGKVEKLEKQLQTKQCLVFLSKSKSSSILC